MTAFALPQQRTTTRKESQQRTEFDRFARLYCATHTRIELCCIEGDPSDRDDSTFYREWFDCYPGRERVLIARCNELAAKAGNVYVSVASYAPNTTARNKRAVINSCWVFVDDARAPDGTVSIETSKGSYQNWYQLDKPVDVATLEQTATRAVHALKTDTCGSDATQIGRWPNTLNTKRKHGGCGTCSTRNAGLSNRVCIWCPAWY